MALFWLDVVTSLQAPSHNSQKYVARCAPYPERMVSYEHDASVATAMAKVVPSLY